MCQPQGAAETMKIGKIINIWEIPPPQGLFEARRGKGVFFRILVTDHK
jgi:hypothetical protein